MFVGTRRENLCGVRVWEERHWEMRMQKQATQIKGLLHPAEEFGFCYSIGGKRRMLIREVT